MALLVGIAYLIYQGLEKIGAIRDRKRSIEKQILALRVENITVREFSYAAPSENPNNY